MSKSPIVSDDPSAVMMNLSAPAPPVSRSDPVPSTKKSAPSPPEIVSFPAFPIRKSSAVVPDITSAVDVPETGAARPEISRVKALSPASAPDATTRCKASFCTEKPSADTASRVVSIPSTIVLRCNNRPSGESSKTDTPSSPPAAAR